jgi:hypothetical protein
MTPTSTQNMLTHKLATFLDLLPGLFHLISLWILFWDAAQSLFSLPVKRLSLQHHPIPSNTRVILRDIDDAIIVLCQIMPNQIHHARPITRDSRRADASWCHFALQMLIKKELVPLLSALGVYLSMSWHLKTMIQYCRVDADQPFFIAKSP